MAMNAMCPKCHGKNALVEGRLVRSEGNFFQLAECRYCGAVVKYLA